MLLLGCDNSMFVDLAAAPAAYGTADAAGGAADGAPAGAGELDGAPEPPRKRARAEGGAPAAPSSAQQQQQQQQQQQVAGSAADAGAAAGAPAAAAAGPVMIVLVGAQGSGKSTFCENLQRAAEQAGTGRRWVRVNQDTIAGKRVGVRAWEMAQLWRAVALPWFRRC